MGCTSPISIETPKGLVVNVACKQCVGCRIRRQSGWTLRNLLEVQQHSSAAFVTLTYRDEVCPDQLDYRDFQLFLKRLRKELAVPIRFFSVGEYGSKTGRPHWHALIYGMPGQEKGHWDTEQWPHGYAYIGQVTPESIRYTARYCLKFGAKGEEAMMRASLKPPLGAVSITSLGAEMGNRHFELSEVPTVISVEGKNWFLDATMQKYFAAGYETASGEALPQKSEVIRHSEYVLRLLEGDPLAESVWRRQTLFEALQSRAFKFSYEEI